MKKIKIGIDLHGVAEGDANFFSALTGLLVDNGHEVHILTGPEITPALQRHLREDLGLAWTHLFSITDHNREIGTPITYLRGNPHMDETDWNRAKAGYCAAHDIQLHLDDSPAYGRYFSTPYARYYANDLIKEKKQIAIMGGSFNPVTTGHIRLAEAVMASLPRIGQVWLMPAFRHPFSKHAAYSNHRIHMLRMVETERIRYFGYEMDHQLSGVTYETFERLSKDPAYKQYEFYMIIGSDCLLEFDSRWRNPELLAHQVKFIIVPRPGYPAEGYDGLLSKPPHIILKGDFTPDVSATQVRDRIQAGQPIFGLVPKPVEEFILTNRLYINQSKENAVHRSSQPEAPWFSCCGNIRNSPAVTVDVAICTIIEDSLKVLMLRRSHEPEKGCWAIPGGFVDASRHENLEETAGRQLSKKAGLENIYIEQLKTYGDVERSPGSRMITVAYFALVPYEKLQRQQSELKEGASEIKWFSLKDHREEMTSCGEKAAFDHGMILDDLLQRIQGKISYTPIAFELVSEKFTWPELRRVYEVVLDKKLDATNFKRKIRSMYRIEDLKSRAKPGSVGRPPSRLRFEGVRNLYI